MTDPTTSRPLIDSKAARARVAAAKPDQAVRTLLEAGDMDAVESRLMEVIEVKPIQYDFFLAMMNALLKRKNRESAELYLQLLLDIVPDKDDPEFLEFCKALLFAWPGCAPARTTVVDALRTAYPDSPNFDAIIEHFTLDASREPLALLEKVEEWLPYDQGHAVYSPNFGVGRVLDINLALDKLRVNFQEGRGKPESFRIGEARKLLEVLPEDHFLLAKLEGLDELQALAKKDPGELLRRLFASENRPLTTPELKNILSGIVSASAWTSWWNKARQDPRLTVGTGARPQCTWADSAEQADDAIAAEFADAGSEQQLELALKHAGRSKELAATMVKTLSDSVSALIDDQPALALETALAVDRLGGSSDVLVALLDRADIAGLLTQVRDRGLRRRGIGLLKDRRDDWVQLYAHLLREESDNTTIAQMYAALNEDDGRGELDRVLTQVLSDPVGAPHLYLWVCREMLNSEELGMRANWKFMQALIGTLGEPALKPYYATLRKFFDPGSVADLVVKQVDDAQGRELLAMLDKGMGLEDYRRDSLRQYLYECHPPLRPGRKEVLFTTEHMLEEKRLEFQKLTTKDIPENTVIMQKAKEHGDLRENFEYHAARARQEMLSSRAKTLHDQLTEARVIDPATIDGQSIAVGTRVTLEPAGDTTEQIVLTILGIWDSDPNNHVVSYLAPAVNKLLGARRGQEVTYDGGTYTVGHIEAWNN